MAPAADNDNSNNLGSGKNSSKTFFVTSDRPSTRSSSTSST